MALSTKTSRRSGMLAAVAIAAIALAGCSSSGSGDEPVNSSGGSTTSDQSADTGSSETAADEVTLTFWGTYGNGGNTTQTDVLSQMIIPAFEAANPGIKINYVDIPYDSLLQKLTTSAAGGELPDLVRSDIGWVAKLASLGVFAQLDGVMPDFDKLSADNYPGSLATNKWNGHYYGLPLDTNTRVLISNQDVLTKAGIDKPPATFDDLKADAPKLAANGVSVFADGGLQGWNVYPWIWSAGGDVTDPDLTKATGYLNSAESVAGIQMLVDLYKQGAIPNLIIGNEGATSTSDGLPSGEYANILDGPWMQGIWTGQYLDFKPVYSPVPAGPGGSISVVGGEDINMTATSQHQDAAMKFLAFTQTADYQLAMAKTGQMAVVKSLDGQEAEQNPELAPFITQLATARPRPPVPEAPAVDGALAEALTKAFDGSATVQQALDEAAQVIDGLLAQTN